MPCYAIDEVVPVVDPTAYVHPTAVLIGDVIVGPGCYVGPCASLRGDFGRIVMGRGANVQDTCVIHGSPGHDTLIEDNGHVGHGAVLHFCHIGRDAMVGMNAVVMDEADIGEQAIVAACAFVPAGMQVPPRTLVAGVPGKVRRELSQQEIAGKRQGTEAYQELTLRALRSMREVEPLGAQTPDRRRLPPTKADALAAGRKPPPAEPGPAGQ
ncbi:MAG TPA: transferase hexapeptide repeat family protein [Ramlibacter sp.]|nr:transferase hexapeptide repeat family protein [Ramlibacter sp.]